MKLGIMQPYFFPYIGYFQLIQAVDQFVIYDDVNYIKQGWINRNRILLDGHEHMVTLAVKGASSFKPINRLEIGDNRNKLLQTISQAYAKARFFSDAIIVVEKVLGNPERNLARFAAESICKVLEYLNIPTPLLVSSMIEKDNELKGADKILQLCKILGATQYINAIGGKSLYEKEIFLKEGILLKFLKTRPFSYPQLGNDYVPWLSIIDVMMFNSPATIHLMLTEYELE